MRKLTWSLDQLKSATPEATSIRQLIALLKLQPSGGNYKHVQRILLENNVDTSHFRGQAWNKGLQIEKKPLLSLATILKKDTSFQSHKLKKRLFKEGIKKVSCEECGWAKESLDGRIPLELDHINGDNRDNRLENLRILCPNCHSLKPTHRGLNKKHGAVAKWYTHNT